MMTRDHERHHHCYEHPVIHAKHKRAMLSSGMPGLHTETALAAHDRFKVKQHDGSCV
jgi:hypothetical protein